MIKETVERKLKQGKNYEKKPTRRRLGEALGKLRPFGAARELLKEQVQLAEKNQASHCYRFFFFCVLFWGGCTEKKHQNIGREVSSRSVRLL